VGAFTYRGWLVVARERLETELCTLAQAGDAEAFATIVRRYQGPVYRICLRYLSRADAEDAAQETFVRAFIHREQFDPARPVLPWLVTVARHICLDRIRKHKPELDADIDSHVSGAHPDARLVARDALNRVAEGMATLPDNEREALMLFHQEGLSYAEISASLEIPMGTVMTLIHRARGRLKQLLQPTPTASKPTRGAEA